MHGSNADDILIQRLQHASSVGSSATLYSRLGAAYELSTSLVPPIPALRHFVYKSRPLVQVVHSSFTTEKGTYGYSGGEEGARARTRLVTLYQTVHEALHSSSASGGGPPKLVYAVNEDEAVLGSVSCESHRIYQC